jgi:glutathione reductase (NADPH)
MANSHDLIVIGTGSAASVAAYQCRKAGWRVAVIDQLPFGGTCALRGCDPKKVLVGAAEAVDHVRRMHGKGVVGEPTIAWNELINFKRTFTEPVPQAREKSFAEAGIDAFHGRAKFQGPHSVAVNGEVLDGRFVLLAVGAAPMQLGIQGEEHMITNTEFLELDQLPKRIVLIGGGYIAAEFSHITARAGANIVILEQKDRMLTPFEPELVSWLMEKFQEIGIEVKLKTRVTGILKEGNNFIVRATSDGKEQSFKTDLVVHAAGRVPDLDSLDLPAAGIETERGRLKLNDFLQSETNSAIYAAGDAAAKGPPLTPVAGRDGAVVAANMLGGNRERPNYHGVPSVVFTIPPIASVGLSEKQAHEREFQFRVQRENARDWYTARSVGERTYGYKVLIENGTERILGAHLVGPHADEVINVFALAIRNDLTTRQLEGTVFAYPTSGFDVSYMLGDN